jgi:hypothetical protein
MASSTTTTTTTGQNEMKNNFLIPKWAGKPASGLHLDVMKEGKMIQKLMIDEKKCYFFGRNKDLCEVQIDHASCSRVHSVLVWHKHLNRPFLIDLNSSKFQLFCSCCEFYFNFYYIYLKCIAHGTFIGSLRLEPNKPQQVFIDSELKFGASTRSYIIRERPQATKHLPSILHGSSSTGGLNESTSNNDSLINNSYENEESALNSSGDTLSQLPSSEAELDVSFCLIILLLHFKLLIKINCLESN